jgi:hypothetical protein
VAVVREHRRRRRRLRQTEVDESRHCLLDGRFGAWQVEGGVKFARQISADDVVGSLLATDPGSQEVKIDGRLARRHGKAPLRF